LFLDFFPFAFVIYMTILIWFCLMTVVELGWAWLFGQGKGKQASF